MKIEFGCGDKPRKSGSSWKYQDVRDLKNIDYVCDVWDIEKFVEAETVDEVFSRHMFEHLSFYQCDKTLKAWHRILKPNAVCEIILPNMDFHVNQWLGLGKQGWNKSPHYKHCMAGFWGWQDRDNPDQNENFWDCHKSGFNLELLSALLKEHSFSNISTIEPRHSPHLHVKCNKI